VSGIPIDPVFALKDKRECRPDMVGAGSHHDFAFGGRVRVGSVEPLINALLTVQHRAQIVYLRPER
jgi:hypothetical protein